MSKQKIPITPSNYAVWFEYLAENNQDLRREMDELLGRSEPLSDSDMRDLYDRCVEETSEKVASAKTALSRVVNALMVSVGQADGHYADFSSELKTVAAELKENVSTDNLNTLVDRAVQATHKALERGADMRQQFSELAVEMQQVRSELVRSQTEARSDSLTGLFNRLAFQEELSKLHEYKDGDSHTPCLLILDIDHFKRVNDSYGHLAGDHVLQIIAEQIKGSVRGHDVVARFGGEEFAILLRDTPSSGCMAVAENVRLRVSHTEIQLPEEVGVAKPIHVTLSIGGAWYRDQEPEKALIDRADRALYRSKEGGRDRVSWER